MTNWRTRTDIEWADDRTVIDPRSLETAKTHVAAQHVPSPLRSAARLKRSRRPRLPRLSVSGHKTALAFAGLAVALILVTGFAVREHSEASALREAMQLAEMNRVDDEPDLVVPFDASQKYSRDPHPAAPRIVEDREHAEQQATDFVVAHNYDAALREFESLQKAFPEHQVYSDLVDVLRWKLRCVNRGSDADRRCN